MSDLTSEEQAFIDSFFSYLKAWSRINYGNKDCFVNIDIKQDLVLSDIMSRLYNKSFKLTNGMIDGMTIMGVKIKTTMSQEAKENMDRLIKEIKGT